jgi:hypothetical protein
MSLEELVPYVLFFLFGGVIAMILLLHQLTREIQVRGVPDWAKSAMVGRLYGPKRLVDMAERVEKNRRARFAEIYAIIMLDKWLNEGLNPADTVDDCVMEAERFLESEMKE